MFIIISPQRAGITEAAMFEANSIIREPEPSPGNRVMKLEYFSQLSVTSVAEVAGNHISEMRNVCMRYTMEFIE